MVRRDAESFAVAREAWPHFVCENAITNFRTGRETKKRKKEKKRRRKEGKETWRAINRAKFQTATVQRPLIVI